MGTIYTLSVSGIKKMKQDEEILSLKNIKSYLLNLEHKKDVCVVCLEDDERCTIFLDGKKIKEIERFFDKDITLYRYDINYGYIEKEFDLFFNEDNAQEEVLFSYHIDKSGVGEQVLVEYEDNYYDLSSYFNKTVVYTSIEAAADAKKEIVRDVLK